ncbi:MAG TPA: VWA domain-containing protein [Thermoanaerobaculia bacterium]|nr:VWA domain-containing protein [Thermoanaerobaculia bacterium]
MAAVVLSLALSSAAPLPLLGQQYGEVIEVRVINIDAVVTDKSGNPVKGLSKDDFEIFENGRKKDISNFMAVEETRATLVTPEGRKQLAVQSAAPARRHVVVFVDQSTLLPMNRNQLIPALKDFVNQAVRPGDEITIFSWSPSLRMDLPFTADKTAALTAIDAIARQGTAGIEQEARFRRAAKEISQMPNDFDSSVNADPKRQQRDINKPSGDPVMLANSGLDTKTKPPYEPAFAAARNFAEQVLYDQRQKAEAVKGVIAQMKSFEGKKLFVFVTESFSTAQAKQIFEHLDAIKDGFLNGKNQSPRAEIARFDDAPLLADVIATANASGVTLYPISAAGKFGGLGNNDASVGAPGFNDMPVVVDNMKNIDQPLQQIAGATGGVALTGSSDFRLGFDRILNDLTSYYSLGYRADGSAADSVHKISVRVKKPGLSVRTREAYVDRSVTSEMNDAVMANLIYPVAKNQLNISVSAGAAAAAAGEDVTVPVDIKIPTASLTLVPEGADLTGRISVYAAFFRRDGATSKVTRQEYPIRFPAESLPRRKQLTVKIAVTANKATDAISIGVMDDVAKVTGFGTAKVAGGT